MSQQTAAGPTSIELVLKGELVLNRITSLQEEIQTALENSDHVLIKLSEASTVDLAFLQLLCSAHRTALLLDKSLTLDADLPEDFHRKTAEAGFSRHLGCRHDNQNSCLWLRQDD
jgi:ABC-type transporter Mla MlaB component